MVAFEFQKVFFGGFVRLGKRDPYVSQVIQVPIKIVELAGLETQFDGASSQNPVVECSVANSVWPSLGLVLKRILRFRSLGKICLRLKV